MVEDYSEYPGDAERTSKYNSALQQLYRLDELWKDTHRHCRIGEFNKWNIDLERVWCELAGDLGENKDDKLVELNFNIHNQKLSLLDSELSKKKMSAKEYREKLYQILMKKELFLRKLQNKLGKGTAWEENDDDYMDG